jgi:ABC-type antimicrobial peptide transport system permease subunit
LEATSVIIASCIVGVGVGYILTVQLMATVYVMQEMPPNYIPNLVIIMGFFGVALMTVRVGTSLGVRRISQLPITKILKGI